MRRAFLAIAVPYTRFEPEKPVRSVKGRREECSRLCAQRVAFVAATHAAHFYLFARLEYQHVGHQVVEDTRDEQGGEVTVDHIPLENLLEDEQEYHLDQESGTRREVEYQKPQEEIACRAVCQAALPNPEVGAHEVAQHGELEADGRREYEFAEIAGEYEMVAYP